MRSFFPKLSPSFAIYFIPDDYHFDFSQVKPIQPTFYHWIEILYVHDIIKIPSNNVLGL